MNMFCRPEETGHEESQEVVEVDDGTNKLYFLNPRRIEVREES